MTWHAGETAASYGGPLCGPCLAYLEHLKDQEESKKCFVLNHKQCNVVTEKRLL